MKRNLVGVTAALMLAAAGTASAQGLDPLWLGQTGMSTMANHLAGENLRNSTGAKSSGTRVACSADSMPAADRRRMEAQAFRIMQRDGRAAGVAYAREQGMAYHRQLQAQGVCP